MKWKYSSVGVRSIMKGLQSSGQGERVLAAVQPNTREALLQPLSQKWHDGSIIVDVSVAAHQVLGDEGVQRIFYQAVRQSIAPMMEPFIKVMLMLGGRRPETLFSKMTDSLKPIMQGVTVEWAPSGAKQGIVTVVHEDEVHDVSFAAWGGSLSYVLDLCGVKGAIVPKPPATNHQRFAFDVRWE